MPLPEARVPGQRRHGEADPSILACREKERKEGERPGNAGRNVGREGRRKGLSDLVKEEGR